MKTVLQNKDQFFYLDARRQPPLVETLYDGLRIIDVTTDSHLHVTVPVHGPDSARARFAYWVEYDGYNATVIHLFKTPAVRVEYSTLYREDLADGDAFPLDHFPLASTPRPADLIREVLAEKFEVRVQLKHSLEAVPEQGEDLIVDPRNTIQPDVPITENDIRIMKERSVELGKTAVDIGVGFIPIVGDAVDLSELIAGSDKWGRKLSTTDRVLTGNRPPPPLHRRPGLAPSATREDPMKLHKLETTDVDRVARLPSGRTKEIVDEAKGLSEHEHRILLHGIDTVTNGSKLSRKLSEAVMPIVDKIGVKAEFEWAKIYDHKKDRFWNHKVNEHYRRWKKKNSEKFKLRNKKPDEIAVEWARRTRHTPGTILRRLLGKGFGRIVLGKSPGAKIPRILNDIPPSPGLTPTLKRQIIADLQAADPKLLNKKVVKYYNSPDYSEAVVDSGFFSIVKGNIGEVLARKVQLELVENYRTIFAGEWFADRIQLISDLRVKGLEFTDGVIGYVDARGTCAYSQ